MNFLTSKIELLRNSQNNPMFTVCSLFTSMSNIGNISKNFELIENVVILFFKMSFYIEIY
jgi:hypothetical protein